MKIFGNIGTIESDLDTVLKRQKGDAGPSIIGRPVTATLRVAKNGDNSDGLSIPTAFTSIPAALDAASPDADDLTLILLAASSTVYDMDITGDPTYAKNVCLRGPHRNWARIVNTHGSATSVLKFTRQACLYDLTIDCGSGSNNGVIITGANSNGARVRRVYFECEDVTGTQTALEISNNEYGIIERVKVHGVQAYTKGLLIDGSKLNNFEWLDLHDTATGIHLVNTSPDNIWSFVLNHDATLGIDIDGGDHQFFHEMSFASCTRNVDDEVGNHAWLKPSGAFDIMIYPDNLTGIQVNTGGGNTYGSDTQLIATGTIDNPFRIVGVHLKPSTSEWYQIRFSDDSGSTFYDILQFDGTKREGIAAPSGTEHIFNKGTRISASVKDVSGNDNVKVWLEIQEI